MNTNRVNIERRNLTPPPAPPRFPVQDHTRARRTPPPAPPRFTPQELEELDRLYGDGINLPTRKFDWFFVKAFVVFVLVAFLLSLAIKEVRTLPDDDSNPFAPPSNATAIELRD